MNNQFMKLIDDVPTDVYSGVKALISDNVAIFRPKSFIVNKKMSSEDYTFIIPSSELPPAQIGKVKLQLKKDSLIVIGSEVDFLCKTYVPTTEYTNIVIKKNFFEDITSEVTGKRKIDFSKIEYGRSIKLLRILCDLENELAHYNNNCPLMVQSLTTQLIIQLLRDSDFYSHNNTEPICNKYPFHEVNYINPVYYSMISFYNKLLPANLKLTPREIEIAAHLMVRFDYDIIANKLFISRNTLKTHVRNLYKKLNVSNRKELYHKVSETYYKL